jgi:hypothetical protein
MTSTERFRSFKPQGRTLAKPFKRLALLASLLVIVALGGCGGGDSSLTKIQGSSATTNTTMLNHWMRAFAGMDFRSNIGTKGPHGLVGEPANYSECAEAAKKIVPRTFTGQLKLTDRQIEQKCHQLHNSVKAQALSYLISVEWTIAEGAEQGLHVSSALLHKEFERYKQTHYPTLAALEKFLGERHLTVADAMYDLRRSILVTRILPKFEAEVRAAGGGQKTYVRLALERFNKLIERTSCKDGYVVPNCREYHGPSTVLPPPNVILEQFAQARA